VSARPRSVAALQLHAHDRADFSERWPHILAQITAAADHGAELIVVPEGTVPAYIIGTDHVDPRILEAAAQDVIAVAARSGATIVYGGARYDGERLANSAYVVTAAGIIGTADKCFLWHFDRRWFRAGEALEPVDTPAGRLGVFVCADGRIPTIASTLVERGAQILVLPTAWVTSGRDPAVLENIQADLMINVRARENGVPLIAANKCGIEARSVAYCGKSAIIAADGSFAARASQDDATTLHARVAVGPALVSHPAVPAAIVRSTSPALLPEIARIAISLRTDAALRELAQMADADFVIDPHTRPDRADIALVEDEAMTDPRALVAPRLDGVRLFIWHASVAGAWVVPFARTRAAELRAYIIVLDTLDRRAFAVDPDGVVVCGTYGAFELAAFSFDRRRTDSWIVAPHTDVRASLLAVETMRR
jgi:predicted amidohydrolase